MIKQFAFLFLLLLIPHSTLSLNDQGVKTRIVYFVSPVGNDANTGMTQSAPFQTIQHAVDLAQPGDTVKLLSGVYFQDVITVRDGTTDAPIRIRGATQAIVHGAGDSHVIEVNHDNILLTGFTVDGLFGDPASADGYRDKLIYAQGIEDRAGVTGLRIHRMHLQNAGGECIRLRYFAVNNTIAYNTISHCGVHDFVFNEGGKNGEGIYIGTAPEQLPDGKNPTTDPDASNGNWVFRNIINTHGNECVDVKETAEGNVVEYNQCTGQLDPKSGGMDARGNKNVFRYNTIYGNLGAGVRLGGDTELDGIENSVYENWIYNNQSGGIKFQRSPQEKICGNTMILNIGGNSVGTYKNDYQPTALCE